MIEEPVESFPHRERCWEDNVGRALSGPNARQAKPLGHRNHVPGIGLAPAVAAFAILHFGFEFH